MNHRNDDSRSDYQSGQQHGQSGSGQQEVSRRRGQYEYDDLSDRYRAQQQGYAQGQPSQTRGGYHAGSQFDERMQSAGWDEGRGDWDYDGGPERYAASGYGEPGQQGYRQVQGRQQYGVQREYSQNVGSDYYSGRQGYGARGSFGSEYNLYGRNQGYGEGSAYTRPQPPRGQQSSQSTWRQGYGTSSRYGGESVGSGGRGSLHGSQNYTDEGEMSGYSGPELGTRQYGSSRRYGAVPGLYGYGSTGNFRGVGPKNYVRSDERLAEEINERLTDDDDLDASEIVVRVSSGVVMLEGNVDQRWMKHRAEDIADSCSGVKEVDNRIQVASASSATGQAVGAARSGTSRAPSQAGATAGAANASGSTGSTTTPH